MIQDGQIVERGQHRDLVQSGGVYQQLYETQFAKALNTSTEVTELEEYIWGTQVADEPE